MECVPRPDAPCRANLDIMPPETAMWMYILTGVAFLLFAYGFYEMVKVWRLGKAWKPGDWRRGLSRFVIALGSHRKFKQDKKPGLMHGWIFYGFVVLFIGTLIVAIDYDIFEHLLGSKLLFGSQYLLFEAVMEVFGIMLIAGTGYAIYRRYVERPKSLHRTKTPESPRWLLGVEADLYALSFLLLIGITGFVLEAIRLRHQVLANGIDYASWSFVGSALTLTFRGVSDATLIQVYPLVWWLHFALWTSVLAILPWTKFKHIVTSSLNVFFHDPLRQSRPNLPAPFSLEKVMASGTTDMPPVGYTTIRDLTWKDRLSLDACTNCGRCEAQCPATASGRPLSPRKLIQDLKAEMWRDYRGLPAAVQPVTAATAAQVPHALPMSSGGPTQNTGDPKAPRPLALADGVGSALQEATLWSCTTCRACVTACPVDIEHVDLIVEMRRGLVMQSKLDENQQRLLINITNAGNPYGFPAADRANWMAKLPPGVVVPTMAEAVAAGKKPEWLWWVGCSGSYDPRNQEVTRSIATILNAAGVEFAILGVEERCNGDPARRMGEEGRFQQSMMENLVTLRQYGVNKIIAQCPHCFNTLGKEYPALMEMPVAAPLGTNDPEGKQSTGPAVSGAWEVLHHSQLIEKLIADGRLKLKQGAELKVTYHDSCYLMRHNGVAEAPRNVIQKANNGLPVLEMAQNKEQGLCCGAGGANMWYEVKEQGERINVIRAKQAADTGADTVATACPFCLTMMKDGLDLTGQEGKMQARDLAEIVADHLDWVPPVPPTPVVAEPSTSEDGAGAGGGGWSG